MENFQIHFPEGLLANCVSSIVYYKDLTPTHDIERLLPDGTINLLIELSENPQYTFENNDLSQKRKFINSWVSGMQTDFISISSSKNSEMMVIQFKPNGAYPIFQIPSSEIANLVIDADLILGDEVTYLREQLLSFSSGEEKIRFAEQWLLERLIRTNQVSEAVVQYAITETMRNPTEITMKSISDKTGYSQQHFINLFKRYVGLTPKQYQKVVRFNQILVEVESRQNIDWARLSLDLGYFDQAHFIRDFKKFSGFSPEKYLDARGEHLNYLPVQ